MTVGYMPNIIKRLQGPTDLQVLDLNIKYSFRILITPSNYYSPLEIKGGRSERPIKSKSSSDARRIWEKMSQLSRTSETLPLMSIGRLQNSCIRSLAVRYRKSFI